MIRFLASVALFIGLLPAASAGQPPDDALWNADRTAAVAATPGVSGTRVTAYLRQLDGTFSEVDLSAVESGNFGKLGRRPSDYEHFETRPVEWLHRLDGLFQVRIQTQAWRNGQRYTVSEPLIFRANGAVIWR